VKRILSFAWLLLLASSVWAQARPRLDIAAVEADLASTTPLAVLEKYFDCSKYEGTAYEGIATGRIDWVRLAERMLAHSDACYTEGIQSALGSAMQSKPRNVLPLVGKTEALSAEHICLPFVSSEQPVASQLAQIHRSRRAIQQVRTPVAQKSACLQFIRPVESRLKDEARSAAPLDRSTQR
jgi:hypothetical protein